MPGQANTACNTSYSLNLGINHLTIPLNSVNDSLQVGDKVFISPTANNSNVNNIDLTYSDPILIGEAIEVGLEFIIISFNNSATGPCAPEVGDYLMFAKDKKVNTSDLKGYYLKANFVNNSTSYAELFSVGSELSESSK